ncbi:MAG: hypothetical protein WKF83_00490 [Nocardioidaceae bacterium]
MSKRWLLIAGAVAFVVLLVILVTIYSGGAGRAAEPAATSD